MKKQFLALAIATTIVSGAFAQSNDTIAKVKSSGTVTMGVRDSSGALSYTLGDGKYAGYHVEICLLPNLLRHHFKNPPCPGIWSEIKVVVFDAAWADGCVPPIDQALS
jgi:ABC-type amino acid transport substrate-binding protein